MSPNEMAAKIQLSEDKKPGYIYVSTSIPIQQVRYIAMNGYLKQDIIEFYSTNSTTNK